MATQVVGEFGMGKGLDRGYGRDGKKNHVRPAGLSG